MKKVHTLEMIRNEQALSRPERRSGRSRITPSEMCSGRRTMIISVQFINSLHYRGSRENPFLINMAKGPHLPALHGGRWVCTTDYPIPPGAAGLLFIFNYPLGKHAVQKTPRK